MARAEDVASELQRARKKPMAPEKMKALLLKLRKNATGDLTFGKLVQVLDTLGWSIEPYQGWTPRHYMYDGKEQLVDESTFRGGGDEGSITALRNKFDSESVESLPRSPRAVGEVVMMDVGPVKKGHGTPVWYFERREWIGTEGVTLSSPSGDTESFLPGRHSLSRGPYITDDSSAVSDLWRWLKTAGIHEAIGQALQMEVHVPAAARTRENTGTCPACWGNYKLSNDMLVLHGYERPGYGFVKGQCVCVGIAPLEYSNQGARAYHALLLHNLTKEEANLDALKNGEVEAIKTRYETVKKGDPSFPHTLRTTIDRTQRLIDQLREDVNLYLKILNAWHIRPLPQQGEPHRGPGFFLK